jgi:hypothetical protein
MTGFLLLPLTKSAWPKGRLGPEWAQDWYRGLVKAVSLRKRYQPSHILIASAFRPNGQISEVENYSRVLRQFGLAPEKDFDVVRQGHETTGQIDFAIQEAKRNGRRLVVVATWLHYPRVCYLVRGRHDVIVHGAFGLPRPYEAVTDIALWFLFPILCRLGLRERLLAMVMERRQAGRL